MKVKDLIKLLEAEGWIHKRTRGDHRVFTKAGHRPVVVSGKLSDEARNGTEASVLRQSGLKPQKG